MVPASLPAWKPAGLERRRDPLEVAWASLTFLIPAIVSLLSKMGSIDLAYHLRAGEDVLHGNIPRVDTYTFTIPGTPWLDQQWLAQGFLAFAHRLGGWPSLLALQAVLVGATFWLVYLAARTAGASPRTGSLLTIAGFVVSSPALVLRPQLLAMPLFGLLLWVVAGRAVHPGRLWLAPVLAALCANIHGSFVLFPVVIGLAWLEDRRLRDPRSGRTLLIGVVTAAATLATPFGPRVVGLRVRRVHQPGHPEDHHRVGAADPRDRSGMARDRVGVRGRCLPRTPGPADTVDGTRHPRAVPPARPVGATRDRVVGDGRPRSSSRV